MTYIKIAFLLGLLAPALPLTAQQKISMIRGSVHDQRGKPVAGLTVTVIEHPERRTTTNKQGFFNITAWQGQHLQFTSAGESVKSVQIRRDTVRVMLKQEGSNRIPIGYYETRSRTGLTQAISTTSIPGEAESAVINPTNTLYGLLPGLTVLQNGGRPPTNPSLTVRGLGTFRDNSPLVLVDGYQQDLSSLTPAAIKSVSLLKDAAATALYGQRGANGVLLITTRRGNFNKSIHGSASYGFGFTRPTTLPKFVGSEKYARAYNEARLNDGLTPRYSPEDISAFKAGNDPYLFPNVNWFDRVLRNHGARMNVNANFSGGRDNVAYFTVLNYANDYGLFKSVQTPEDYSTQLKYSRFNFRTNLDFNVTSHFYASADVGGVIIDSNVPGGYGGVGGVFNSLYSVPSAVFPVKYPDGAWGGTQIYDNPVAMQTATGYADIPNSRQFFLRGRLREDLNHWLKGLAAEADLSYNNYGAFREEKTKQYSYEHIVPVRDNSGTIIDSTKQIFGQSTGLNYGDDFQSKRVFTDLYGKVDYDRSIGFDSLQVMVLAHRSSISFNGRDRVYHRVNFAGNLHYAMHGKYFFDVTASYGGNNQLPKGERYHFFPAVSAGWLLSRENFLRDVHLINWLKIRASWGITGNDRVPDGNPYQQNYGSAGGYRFTDRNNYLGGYHASGQLASTDFRGETSHMANLGLDARMLDKLDISIDFFYERRTNILTGTGGSLSDVIGIQAPLNADGIVKNKGFEVGVQWQDHAGNFGYHIGGNFSFAQNKIINEDEQFRPYDYLKRTGGSVRQPFGLQAIGFFKNQQDIANSPEQVFSKVQPGDIKYKDQNGDGIINQYDEIPLGQPSFPEMYFSAAAGLGFSGFTLSARIVGTSRYSTYLGTKSVFRPIIDNNTISTYYYNHRWTPSTAATATLPRLTTKSNQNNFRSNSLFRTDRSYISLREVKLSYALPAKILGSTGLNGVKIFVKGLNLLTIDDIPQVDPRNMGASYPILRSYNVGLKVKF